MTKRLKIHGKVQGIAEKLSMSTADGIPMADDLLNKRKEIYGINEFT